MENRRKAFQEFMCNIPRCCSPSLVTCHWSAPRLPDSSPQFFDPNFNFNWSIDQVAALQPADFSTELNASFYQLDKSVDEAIRNENEDFFNQSRVLPSPDVFESNARDGFVSCLSPRGMSFELQGTPSRDFADMSVSEAKLPTPVTVCKTRQRTRKKKLFSEDSIMSEVLTEMSDSEPHRHSMSCFRSDSFTAMQSLDQSMPEMSPIVGQVSRVMEMGSADETFASESGSSVMMQSNASSGGGGGRRRVTRLLGLHPFAFKTSTPTTSHC